MRRGICAAGSLALALCGPIPSAVRAETLALMPVKLLDTSGEVRNQDAEHAARIAAMEASLARDLGAIYGDVVPVSSEEIAAACPAEASACLLGLAQGAGAETAFFAVVVKTSTLILQMFVQIVDVRQGTIIDRRELSFRGDSDESWRRAERFLVRNLDGR